MEPDACPWGHGAHNRFTCILASIIQDDPNGITPAIGYEDSRYGMTLHYRTLTDDAVTIGTCPDCRLGGLTSVSIGDPQAFVAVNARFEPDHSHREVCEQRQRRQRAAQKAQQTRQRKAAKAAAKAAKQQAQGNLF